MIRTRVRSRSKNAARAVERGTKDALFDAADAGFRQAMEDVPHGATSGLAMSGFEPQESPDGGIEWGFGADYSTAVVKGTRPHWAPIEPLKLWARRVLGSVSAAWPVQRKIAAEGTPAQDFITPAVDTMKAKLRGTGIGGYIEEAFRQ